MRRSRKPSTSPNIPSISVTASSQSLPIKQIIAKTLSKAAVDKVTAKPNRKKIIKTMGISNHNLVAQAKRARSTEKETTTTTKKKKVVKKKKRAPEEGSKFVEPKGKAITERTMEPQRGRRSARTNHHSLCKKTSRTHTRTKSFMKSKEDILLMMEK